MSIDSRALPAFLGDDATFRTWGLGIAAQIASTGLVQTADTGQINWTTVLRPVGAGTTGYEIYRFADALQSTHPVFIKMEYGVGATIDRPSLMVTTGTATNGAGTITGQFGARIILVPQASKTAGAVLNSYCSGSTSRLSLVTHLDPAGVTTFCMVVMIERPKDAAGVEQNTCIVTASRASTNLTNYQLIPFAGSIPATMTAGWPSLVMTGGLTVSGASVSLSPAIVFCGVVGAASWLVYLNADIGELVPFACTHLGTSHTFMPMGDGSGSANAFTQSAAGGYALAIPWE